MLEFKNNLWGARNRVGIGLSYRLARIHRLAESIPGLLKRLQIRALGSLKILKNCFRYVEKGTEFEDLDRSRKVDNNKLVKRKKNRKQGGFWKIFGSATIERQNCKKKCCSRSQLRFRFRILFPLNCFFVEYLNGVKTKECGHVKYSRGNAWQALKIG